VLEQRDDFVQGRLGAVQSFWFAEACETNCFSVSARSYRARIVLSFIGISIAALIAQRLCLNMRSTSSSYIDSAWASVDRNAALAQCFR